MNEVVATDKSTNKDHQHPVWHISEKIIIPLAIAVLAYYGKQASDRLVAAQVEVAKLGLERQATESNSMLQLKYIELFYKDIQDPDPQKRQASISLLAAMQPSVAEMIARAVAADPNASQQVKRQVSETLTAAQRFGPLGAYRIVIYHEKRSLADARQVETYLTRVGFSGRIELREQGPAFLPDATAYGYHIRYDDKFENEAADYLLNLAQQALPNAQFRIIKIVPPKAQSDRTLTVFLFNRA